MDLTPRQAEVARLLEKRPRSRYEIAEEMSISPDTVAFHVMNLREEGVNINYNYDVGKYELLDNIVIEDDERSDLDEIAEDLETGITYEDFQKDHGYGQAGARDVMERLRSEGYNIEFKEINSKGEKLFYIPDEHEKQYQIGNGGGHYRFGLISDTHLGSEAEHLDDLHDFYDRIYDEGIDTVFHAGDISDGWEVHKGHINEIKGRASGWDRLLNYVVDEYPSRPGVNTLFIEGNHDSKYHRRNGIHFGALIDSERKDLHYCGDSMARFVFDEKNDIDLELMHPSGGSPYSVGYRLQTLYRERPVDDRPTIAGVGHLHGSMYAETEGVKGFYTGCWKGLTTWGKRKGFNSCIGGWIIDLKIENGEIRRITPSWVGYESDGTTNNFSLEEIGNYVSE